MSKSKPKQDFSALEIDYETLPTNLNYALDELVACDNEFCPDYKDTYMDAIFLLWQFSYPDTYKEMVSCIQDERPEYECGDKFITGLNRLKGEMRALVEKKRYENDADPLVGFDPIRYNSPFWYEGSGDIWRRLSHGSNKVSIGDCQRIHTDMKQCLADPSKPQDYCYRLYGHSLVCESGVNCDYLRFPMMQCLQTHAIPDYEALKNCMQSIPNYTKCTKAPTPPPTDV